MTIAACHVSPEGIVLGADSTSTITRLLPGGRKSEYHLDHEQKMFEVGERGSATVGLATWGLGRIGRTSHRLIAARLAAQHKATPFPTLKDMADSLANMVWTELLAAHPSLLAKAFGLLDRFNADPDSLSLDELKQLQRVQDMLSGGYFLAGRVDSPAECEAFEVEWSVVRKGATVIALQPEAPNFRGVPHMMERLIMGYDSTVPARILDSGKWNGTEDELLACLQSGTLVSPELLPLREAIDWIHTVIHTTIRAVKFSGWHACGGPVEVAVVTADRPYRWVCHKGLDSAIITSEGKNRYDQ